MASYTITASGANSTAVSCGTANYCGTAAGAVSNYWRETAGGAVCYHQVRVENHYPYYVDIEPGTEEQRQQRGPRAEERRQALRAAEELLKEYIGLEAFGRLHEVGYIEVDSQRHKGRKYRVPNGSRLIGVINEQGKVIDSLCVMPGVSCPPPDQTLARILLLEADEDYVLAKANSQGIE